MFGLSLGKILLTILIIVILWKGFTLVTRIARDRDKALARQAGGRPTRRRRRGEAVELIRCRRCGAYFDPAEGCRCGQDTH
jgi:hypothetical protein